MPNRPADDDIRRAVDAVDWAAYSMPPSVEDYEPERVPRAFDRILSASNEEQGRDAYDAMLSAVGNNHAGWLYPAALPAAKLIIRIARECGGFVRWSALEVLIEFLSFGWDPKWIVDPSDGKQVHLRPAVVAMVQDMRAELELMAVGENGVAPTPYSAGELVSLLDEEDAGRGPTNQ